MLDRYGKIFVVSFTGFLVMFFVLVFAWSASATTVYTSTTNSFEDGITASQNAQGERLQSAFDLSSVAGTYLTTETFLLGTTGNDASTYTVKAYIVECTGLDSGCGTVEYSTERNDIAFTGSEQTTYSFYFDTPPTFDFDDSKYYRFGVYVSSCSGACSGLLAYVLGSGNPIANALYSNSPSSTFDVYATITTDALETDPRENPMATIILPTGSYQSASYTVPLYVTTDVDSAEYAEEDPDLNVDVEKWDGDSWEEWAYGIPISWNGKYDDDGNYAFGDNEGSLSLVLNGNGSYRVAAAATFPPNDEGAVSDWTEFDVNIIPYGGGGGGSWGGDDEGGAGEWSDALDTAWSDKPTCSVLGSSLFWESEGSTGTGLACVGEWIRFMIVPPADSLFNYVQKPMDMLLSRWPMAYFQNIVVATLDGFQQQITCPLPDIDGGTYQSVTAPDFDLCTPIGNVADYVEDNTAVKNIIVATIWLALGIAVFRRTKAFLLT